MTCRARHAGAGHMSRAKASEGLWIHVQVQGERLSANLQSQVWCCVRLLRIKASNGAKQEALRSFIKTGLCKTWRWTGFDQK